MASAFSSASARLSASISTTARLCCVNVNSALYFIFPFWYRPVTDRTRQAGSFPLPWLMRWTGRRIVFAFIAFFLRFDVLNLLQHVIQLSPDGVDLFALFFVHSVYVSLLNTRTIRMLRGKHVIETCSLARE